MVKGQAGKGDRYRPYHPKEWDRAWLRIFGVMCTECKGSGWLEEYDKEIGALEGVEFMCSKCNGNGFIEREKKC